MHLKFDAVSRPVSITQGFKLLPHLSRRFAKWPFREVPVARYGDPVIGVLQDEDGSLIQAPWIEREEQYDNTADLTDALARHLIRCWMQENEPILAVSAAAARIGDGLLVFIGGPQSGKSTLVTCLSVCGHAAFADAVLPISPTTNEGIALGLAPRLRLPLPDSVSGPLAEQLDWSVDRCGADIGYLRPRDAELAAFGDRLPIRAFVLLDRTDDRPAALRPAAASTVLKRLLLGSFDTLPSTHDTLAVLHGMVGSIPCYRLTWSEPQEAVGTLRSRLGTRQSGMKRSAGPDGAPYQAQRRRASGPRTPSGRLFRHAAGLDARPMDGDLFLVDPGGVAIYHLNALGTGLWRLLDGFHGLDDVVSILGDAFPTVDGSLIEADVAHLIADLADRGLIVEHLAGTGRSAPDSSSP